MGIGEETDGEEGRGREGRGKAKIVNVEKCVSVMNLLSLVGVGILLVPCSCPLCCQG